jgi:uncharacterized protein YecT (DUF1311 family)
MLQTPRTVILLCCLAGSAPCAKGQGEKIDCANAMATYELNYCAEQEFQKADSHLNDVYRRVLSRIPEIAGEKPYDAKSFEDALRASQRAWLAFRDVDCKDLVPMTNQGGTATTADVLGCLTKSTIDRADELSARYLPE